MSNRPKLWMIVALSVVWCAEYATANDAFQKWQQRRNQTFQSYLTAKQAAFKQSLQEDWARFKLRQPEAQFKDPKLSKAPVAPNPDPLPQAKPSLPQPDVANIPPRQPRPVTPAAPQPAPPSEPLKDVVSVDYLGVTYTLARLNPPRKPVQPDKQVIAETWEQFYPQLTTVATAIGSERQFQLLPDWGKISLLERYVRQLTGNDNNASQVMLWALLMELGYDARLAYDKTYIYLLLPSQQKIYARPAVTVGKQRYYALTGRTPSGALYTYSGQSQHQQNFDFSFHSPQFAGALPAKSYRLHDPKTGLSVTYSTYPQLQSYYRHHPQLDFVWYFRARLYPQTHDELVATLKQQLQTQPKTVQVAMLLSLIQHGFDYELDNIQWGEEYYATPMHTLMLRSVDCEDRSFLFAYLVREVTGLDTVGLKYPGHLAVAVAVDPKDMPKGATYVLVHDRPYFIADPTYIGAGIGQVMPMFTAAQPQIIMQ